MRRALAAKIAVVEEDMVAAEEEEEEEEEDKGADGVSKEKKHYTGEMC